MGVERIVTAIHEQEQIIAKANIRIRELTDSLLSCPKDDWDWISVKKGAEMLCCSVQTIYGKINKGELNSKHIGSKKLVRISELKRIDDKFDY